MVFIGIDLGTSGVRAIAINQQKEIMAQAQTTLPASISTQAGYYQQDPQDWLKAVIQVLKQLKQKNVHSLAIDGTSASILLADAQGNPITPALMYNDVRAKKEAAEIKQIMPQSIAASANSSLAKVYWLYQHTNTSKAKYALHQADWISNTFAAKFGFSDQHNSLKCGYNALEQDWEQPIKQLPFPFEWLPQVQPSGTVFSHLSKQYADLTGLSTTTKIIAGTTDSTAAALASGISKVGQGITSLGSTLVFKILSKKPYFDSTSGVYSHRLGQNWLVGGASNTGGAVLLQHFSLTKIKQLIGKIDPQKIHDLNYYPLLTQGERFPINDLNLMPKILPRPRSDADFLLALIDGLVDIESLAYQRLNDLGMNEVKQIYSLGGGVKNQLWQARRELKLNPELIFPRHQDAAYGAALLAIQAV